MLTGERPGDRPAPVVADQVEAFPPECGRHGKHVRAELRDRVRLDTLGTGAARVAALARGDRSITGIGQSVQRVEPAGPGLRKAVEQEHERTIGGTCRERVEAHAPRR